MVDVGALSLLVNKKNVHLEAERKNFSCIVWHWGGIDCLLCIVYSHRKGCPLAKLWKYSLDTQYPTVLPKFRDNNREVVLLCDLVLCGSSASCQICAHSAPGPPSLLWQSHQILSLPLCLVLADLMLGIADARKPVSNPLWVQLKINSSTSTEPRTFLLLQIPFQLLFKRCSFSVIAEIVKWAVHT